MGDEWTFVQPKKRSSSKSSSIKNNKRHERNLAKAKQLLNTIYAKDDEERRLNHVDEDDNNGLESTIHLVEKCMRDLDKFNAPHTNFSIPGLVESIQEAANTEISTIMVEGEDGDVAERIIDEIVCYGIGTFYIASGENMQKRYNPPLIQLACVLLLRRAFALYRQTKIRPSSQPIIGEDDSKHDETSGTISRHSQQLTYQQQQDMQPMVYFEPFIQPLERKVLAHFYVKVLDINEQGKRRISNQHQNQQSPSSDTKTGQPPAVAMFKSSTLFYMPHCPMRLYSNVLWANWNIEDEEDLLMDGRIVIMGNSFQAYDDRIISLEKKKDKTNAIFPLLPFVRETKVLLSKQRPGGTKKKKATPCMHYGMTSDALSLQEVELSFNDCAIISFSNVGSSFQCDGSKVQKEGSNLGISLPKRPEEYFVESSGVSEVI